MWKTKMLENVGESGGEYDKRNYACDFRSLEPPALKHKVHAQLGCSALSMRQLYEDFKILKR